MQRTNINSEKRFTTLKSLLDAKWLMLTNSHLYRYRKDIVQTVPVGQPLRSVQAPFFILPRERRKDFRSRFEPLEQVEPLDGWNAYKAG
jgi:hypothetical protein